jgi:acyl carrier protein
MNKLKRIITDVFLLTPDEFRLDLSRDEVDTWDSLGVVSLAVAIQETFGYHLTPDEASGLNSVQDIVNILKSKGIELND